jgi:hypothetical protein
MCGVVSQTTSDDNGRSTGSTSSYVAKWQYVCYACKILCILKAGRMMEYRRKVCAREMYVVGFNGGGLVWRLLKAFISFPSLGYSFYGEDEKERG